MMVVGLKYRAGRPAADYRQYRSARSSQRLEAGREDVHLGDVHAVGQAGQEDADRLDHRGHLLDRGDVGTMCGEETVRHPLHRLQTARRAVDLRAGPRQSERGGQSDTAGGARDQRPPPAEVGHSTGATNSLTSGVGPSASRAKSAGVDSSGWTAGSSPIPTRPPASRASAWLKSASVYA